MPPSRAESVHEVASAVDPGVRPPRIEDALAVFTVSAPTEDWDIPVLAVADSLGGRARGGLATTAATDTLTDALGGRMLRLDLSTRGWQASIAQAVDGAFLQASRRLGALAREGDGPASATLTAALIVGDWLAVAHVGTSRVYRLGRGELEQLTLDGARGKLGDASAEQPSIRFVPIRSGDVILVCSDGLHRYVDGEELAGHLAGRRALGDIASTLIALAKSRGGDDNIALCLARIGRLPSPGLPEPEPLPLRLTDEVGTKLLPRYRVGSGRRGAGRAVRAGLVAVGALALTAVGVRGWQALASRVDGDALRPDPVARETLATRSNGDVARPPEVALVAPEPVATSPQPPVATRVPEPEPTAPARTLPRPSVADSSAAARREAARLAAIRERARRDSIAAARAAEDERLADSIAAAALTALRAEEEQRARDSVAAVERRAREEAAARERALADQRSREQTAREEELRRQQAREARLSAGRQELQDWLWELTNAVKRGDGAAPVLRQGPPRFAEFVTKSRPDVGEARITQMSVSEATGTANAEFTLKWRTEFGTSSTRRVRASASIAPAGGGWTLRGWQILEGAP